MVGGSAPNNNRNDLQRRVAFKACGHICIGRACVTLLQAAVASQLTVTLGGLAFTAGSSSLQEMEEHRTRIRRRIKKTELALLRRSVCGPVPDHHGGHILLVTREHVA